jgi:hypothetical protein
MNNVVDLRPKQRRITDAELYGTKVGAMLNASILDGQSKELWQMIADALMELEERRKAEKWGGSRG